MDTFSALMVSWVELFTCQSNLNKVFFMCKKKKILWLTQKNQRKGQCTHMSLQLVGTPKFLLLRPCAACFLPCARVETRGFQQIGVFTVSWGGSGPASLEYSFKQLICPET